MLIYKLSLMTATTINIFCVVLRKIFFMQHISISPKSVIGWRSRFWLRSGGRIEIGKIKARGDIFLFADGGEIKIADGCFFNNSCSITSLGSVQIEEDTIFGEGVKIYDHNHVTTPCLQKSKFSIKPIVIGRRCWIGSNVIILGGVRICDDVVIGAGAVVTRSIINPGIYVSRGVAKLDKLSRVN